MSTRQLASHYEINQHYLQQDIRNAISLIVDNMKNVSDAQLRVIREKMDDEVLKRYADNKLFKF